MIFFLPLIAFILAGFGVRAFFRTERLSGGRKFLCFVLLVFGTLICVSSKGHCDIAGFCKQTKEQSYLTDVGAVLVLLSIGTLVTGLGAVQGAKHGKGLDSMQTKNPYPPRDERHAIWQQGYSECQSDVGMTYDGNPESPRSRAYDEGRSAGDSDFASTPGPILR